MMSSMRPKMSQDDTPLDPLITLADVARMARVTYRTVLRWKAQGRLPPPCGTPGYPRWTLTSIQRWTDQHRV